MVAKKQILDCMSMCVWKRNTNGVNVCVRGIGRGDFSSYTYIVCLTQWKTTTVIVISIIVTSTIRQQLPDKYLDFIGQNL